MLIPAYEAPITNSRLGSRILEILMKGVSTRQYKEILPQMADTVGVSESQISREFMVSSEKKFKQLAKWLEREYPSAAAIQPPPMTGTSSRSTA